MGINKTCVVLNSKINDDHEQRRSAPADLVTHAGFFIYISGGTIFVPQHCLHLHQLISEVWQATLQVPFTKMGHLLYNKKIKKK